MTNEPTKSGRPHTKMFGQHKTDPVSVPLFGSKSQRSGRTPANASPAAEHVLFERNTNTVKTLAPEDVMLNLPQASNKNAFQQVPPSVFANRSNARVEELNKKILDELYSSINLAEFSRKKQSEMQMEIRQAVSLVQQMRHYSLTPFELEQITNNICDEMLGFGPLESLLARDDIADIMVNGPDNVYIEVNGRVERSDVRFRDAQQLSNICRRIANQMGRRIDDSSPMCDCRLPDGSRVNIVFPPLVLDGASLTIRKFKKESPTLNKLVQFGAFDARGARLLQIIAKCRVNVIISGGTGSGKTTLLNALTGFIGSHERIITCEDAAELQLQQPHVVRMETRPPNIENAGAITMRDLVRNCLRMRPERIIVGEVRGAEAFDLLQAMNTGHDGSMGTLHANMPREAVSRLENMIAMANLNIPILAIRQQIAASVNVIIQTQRLHDGSRRVTHITEVTGMEGEVLSMQDLYVYDITGEDENGRIVGQHKSTGLQPRFLKKAKEYGLDHVLIDVMKQGQL